MTGNFARAECYIYEVSVSRFLISFRLRLIIEEFSRLSFQKDRLVHEPSIRRTCVKYRSNFLRRVADVNRTNINIVVEVFHQQMRLNFLFFRSLSALLSRLREIFSPFIVLFITFTLQVFINFLGASLAVLVLHEHLLYDLRLVELFYLL